MSFLQGCGAACSQHRLSVCRHGAIKCYFVHWPNLFIISKRHAEETCPGYWFLRIVLRPWVEMTDWAAGLAGTMAHAFVFFENRECMTRCSQDLHKDPLTQFKPSKAFTFCCLFDCEKQKLFMKMLQPSRDAAVSWSQN